MSANKEAWKKAKAEGNEALADEIEADAIGHCEHCDEPIFDGERHNWSPDVKLCAAHAPAYADVLARPDSFLNEDDEPMTTAEAEAFVAEHLAAGGSLEDKMVWA